MNVHLSTKRSLTLLGAVAMAMLAVTGCEEPQKPAPPASSSAAPKKSAPAAAKSTPTPAASSSAAQPASPASEFKGEASGIQNEKSRKVVAKFVKLVEAGDKSEVIFSVTNNTGAAFNVFDGRIYSYDDKGKSAGTTSTLEEFTLVLGAGETKDWSYKIGGDKERKKAATIELEIHAVRDDKKATVWRNDNLVNMPGHRAPGGETDEQLAARTGEKVLGYYSKPGPKRSLFVVKNVSDKEIKSLVAAVYYYDEKGAQLSTDADNITTVDVVLKPGETKEIEAGKETASMPPGAKAQEITVYAVDFADGADWNNYNLRLSKRPKGG